MDNKDMTQMIQRTRQVFSDPVAYLAQFGIDSEIVADEELPLAA